MALDPDLAGRLGGADLPAAFDRWRVELPPGSQRPTTAGEWAGCLVLVECGRIEVDCLAGGHRSFAAGDLLALGWLPLERLRNPGTEVARLLAVRRHGSTPRSAYLHVTRSRGAHPMTFRTTIELGGQTATGFRVPDDVVAALGSGKRPKVVVHIGSHTYRSTVAVMDGVFMLPLSAENRTAAGVAAGDEVEVRLQLDTAPREIEIPDDLAAALAADADAQRTWDALSYSNRRYWAESVSGAKAADTRARRVEKAVATLRTGKPR